MSKLLFRVGLYAACACVVSWPLLPHIATHLPLGTETSATVPLFNLWTLLWNSDRLRHGYTGYWNAPIFYPTPGALALSEPQPLTGLFFTAIAFLTRNPALAYNLVLLTFLTLNGMASYTLFAQLGLEAVPALLSGIPAVSLPFVLNELGVLQLTAIFPIFMALAALVAFARQGDLRSAIGLGLWAAATFLICEYYGLFLTLFVGVAAIIFVRGAHLAWMPTRHLLAGLAAAALPLLLILPAQQSFTSHYTRSTATIKLNSAQPDDYLRVSRDSSWQSFTPWIETGGGGERLYPGAILLRLGLIGAIEAWRRGQRRWMMFCVLGAGLAFILSLGLNLQVANFRPYDLLRNDYPGFRQLRSPFRFAVFAQILLAGLAGFGVAWWWRRPHRIGRGLAIGLVALSVLETSAIPARLSAFPFERLNEPWIMWLASQPPGPVAMAPFPASGQSRAYEPTTVAMLQAFEYGHPLVNGYSGFFPSSYLALRYAMQKFPDDESVGLLIKSGAVYLVIERDWLTPERSARLASYPVQLLFADAQVQVYRLAGQ